MNNNPVFQLLRSDGSITINKALIHAVGLNEAIIYSELLSRYFYFAEKQQLSHNDTFYNSVNDLLLGTGIHDKSQRTAIKNLEKHGLLSCVIAGLPKKRYFKIIFDDRVINHLLIEGKQNIVKLKVELDAKTTKSLEKLENITILPKGIIEEAPRPINNTNINNTTKQLYKNENGYVGKHTIKRRPTLNNKSNYSNYALDVTSKLANVMVKNM